MRCISVKITSEAKADFVNLLPSEELMKYLEKVEAVPTTIACPMDVHPAHQPHSPECIMCGKCMAVCPQQALYWGKERDLSIAKVD